MGTLRIAALAAFAAALSGCNSMEVRPAPPSTQLGLVCIVHNPAVAVRDFVDVLQAGFVRHGLRTQVVRAEPGPECDASLTYTAERSWDFVPYLSLAEMRLWRRGVLIGSVYYRHRNGMSLVKWSGTDSKMDPLIDQLLAGVAPASGAEPVPGTGEQAAAPAPASNGACESCKRIKKP